jgi:hypothetical protein
VTETLGELPALRVRSKLPSAAKAVATVKVKIAAAEARVLIVMVVPLVDSCNCFLDDSYVLEDVIFVHSAGELEWCHWPLLLLLKDDGVARTEACENLGFGAVGDAYFDVDLTATVLLFGVGDFDGGVAVFVVENGLLRNGEDVFVFVEEDLSVGRHVGFEFAAWIVDGDTNFEGGDIIFFDAKWRDFGDFSKEGFVLEGFNLDAGSLAKVDLADVGLIHLALDVDLIGVTDGHDEGGGGSEDEDGADGVTDLDVAREDGAIHRRGDGGVAELFFELFEGGLILGYLRLGLVELRRVYSDLRDGLVAGVAGREVLLLGVVEGLLRDDSLLRHLEVALVGVLVHGKIGSLGVDLVILDGGRGGVRVGLGCSELGFLGGNLIENLLLVELGENLTLVHMSVDVGIETGDDARGLGFDFHLGDGLDLAGGDYGSGDVSPLDLGEL